MPKKTKDTDSIIATVPLPSGDLIAYRFDQIDDKLEKLDQKLENMQAVFVTREESAVYRQELSGRITEHDKAIESVNKELKALRTTDDRQQGAIEAKRDLSAGRVAIIAAIGSIIGGIAEAILILGLFHK